VDTDGVADEQEWEGVSCRINLDIMPYVKSVSGNMQSWDVRNTRRFLALPTVRHVERAGQQSIVYIASRLKRMSTGEVMLADAYFVKCPDCGLEYMDGEKHLCRPRTVPALAVVIPCPGCGKRVSMFVHSGAEYRDGDVFGTCPSCRVKVLVRFDAAD
jgi:endogenous inhibitor of DNA gyrase (YacG/DUF329 family)